MAARLAPAQAQTECDTLQEIFALIHFFSMDLNAAFNFPTPQGTKQMLDDVFITSVAFVDTSHFSSLCTDETKKEPEASLILIIYDAE